MGVNRSEYIRNCLIAEYQTPRRDIEANVLKLRKRLEELSQANEVLREKISSLIPSSTGNEGVQITSGSSHP